MLRFAPVRRFIQLRAVENRVGDRTLSFSAVTGIRQWTQSIPSVGSLRQFYTSTMRMNAGRQQADESSEGSHRGNGVASDAESTPQNPNGQVEDASNASQHETSNGQGVADSDANSEVVKLKEQLAARDEKVGELQERLLRMLAEMENVRTIARRDVDNAKRYGLGGFAKELLTVADHLALALKAVDKEKIGEGDAMLRGLYEGVGGTEKELQKVLGLRGIVRFGSEGDDFDPNKHQAMFETPIPNVEGGKIISVTKTGYTIGDRILRPAEVGVSKAA